MRTLAFGTCSILVIASAKAFVRLFHLCYSSSKRASVQRNWHFELTSEANCRSQNSQQKKASRKQKDVLDHVPLRLWRLAFLICGCCSIDWHPSAKLTTSGRCAFVCKIGYQACEGTSEILKNSCIICFFLWCFLLFCLRIVFPDR